MPSGNEYQKKRDFKVTPEPAFGTPNAGSGPLRFAVQKHTARRLHWDLRLELDGVLKSWAVPKGPSLNPADKRLAVMTEDHPLSYAEFEGVIPKGQYGGGEMILWDEGIYVADDGPGKLFLDRAASEAAMRQGIEAGKLSFTLYGRRLRGSFTLVKTSKGDWLLIKHHDGFVSTEDLTQLEDSVRTGLTNEDLEQGSTAQAEFRWMTGAVQGPMKAKPLPMLSGDARKPYSNPDHTFELKLDGIRILAVKQAGKVRLLTRSGRDVASQFPTLSQHLTALPDQEFILDGEIVTFDDAGVPRFGKLMERFHLANPKEIARQDAANPTTFCAFDLPYLNGWELSKARWSDRRKALEKMAPASPYIRVLDTFEGEGELLFQHAVQMGFEGVMGKRKDSAYLYGERSPAWIKVKHEQREEFLIGGFTEGQGVRQGTLGALLVGRPLPDGGLEFAGSVGTGFDDKTLQEIRTLIGDPVSENPFRNPVEANGKPHWVQPKHWVEVRYGEIAPSSGHLRFPVYERMRLDLSPPEAVPSVARDLPELVEQALGQLDEKKLEFFLELGPDRFKVSNLDKVLWPETDFAPATTKRDLLKYLCRAAAYILPHLQDRPLSIVRYPEGLGGQSFYQKHLEEASPDFVEHIFLYSSHNNGPREFLACNNLATLLWLGQMASLELHPWYSRARTEPDLPPDMGDYSSSDESMDASSLNYPDFMVFDLDPQMKQVEKGTFVEDQYRRTIEVALALREMLAGVGLRGFVKSSGKSGLHIYIPIAREYDYDSVRLMAEAFGRHLVRLMPEHVTMEWVVSKRPDKIFFDHNQNVRGKTLSSVFSPRAAPGATISAPVRWEDLEAFQPRSCNVRDTDPRTLAGTAEWMEMLRIRQKIG